MKLSKRQVLASIKAKQLSARADQMCQCTGLAFADCTESLNAIREGIGEVCFYSANEKLYRLILTYRKVGYTPRRAAFRAIRELYGQGIIS
jgi:hypothetical protein